MVNKTVAAQMVDAIRTEDAEQIRCLLQANPEQTTFFTPFGSQTWLGYASQIGKLGSVKALIDGGLDANQGDKRDNRRPICSAAANCHVDVVAYLLSCGVQLDASLSVRNPLFSAIVGRSPDIVRLLLQAGMDSKVRYNSETMKDMDAVAFALMHGEAECAEIIALWNAKGENAVAVAALLEADKIAEENAR